jgi:gamma-glutamylputrescine oxidase
MPAALTPESYYAATANRTIRCGTLRGDHQADVGIIGGGYTGLSSALHLAERGYRVALLEANTLAWGASGRNGGHVSVGQRMDQRELEKLVGAERARKLWRFGLHAASDVRKLISQHQIDCDLQEGELRLAAKPAHARDYERYAQHLAEQYDYTLCDFLSTDALREHTAAQGFHGGLRDLGGFHLHPLNYALGVAAAAQTAGAQLYTHSAALRYRERSGGIQVYTAQGSLRCQQLILACNGYLQGLAPRAERRIMPINNFMLATAPLSDAQRQQVSRSGYALSDSRFVISYWRVAGDGRLLFGGGETYTRRFPADIKRFVRPYMLRAYPMLTEVTIDYGWGGTLAITRNRLPLFGRLSPNIYYAMGYSGHGIPTATFAGRLLAEAIAAQSQRFDMMASLPVPDFPGGTWLRWPGLFLGMAYYALRDRLG